MNRSRPIFVANFLCKTDVYSRKYGFFVQFLIMPASKPEIIIPLLNICPAFTNRSRLYFRVELFSETDVYSRKHGFLVQFHNDSLRAGLGRLIKSAMRPIDHTAPTLIRCYLLVRNNHRAFSFCTQFLTSHTVGMNQEHVRSTVDSI